MKKYIKAMGVDNPAHTIPESVSFRPTLRLASFKNLVNVAGKTDNVDLVNGLIQLVIDDIKIDSSNDGGNAVSVENIKAYYLKYYNAVHSVKSADVSLLQQLKELVR